MIGNLQTLVSGNRKTGFAALSPEQRIEMAKRGNAAARQAGNNGFSSETAKIAGAIALSKRKITTPSSGAPAAPPQA